MTDNDKHLLDIYMDGFNDELLGLFNNSFENQREIYAYNLGGDHAIIGDEVSSIDTLTSDQIITQIKKIK